MAAVADVASASPSAISSGRKVCGARYQTARTPTRWFSRNSGRPRNDTNPSLRSQSRCFTPGRARTSLTASADRCSMIQPTRPSSSSLATCALFLGAPVELAEPLEHLGHLERPREQAPRLDEARLLAGAPRLALVEARVLDGDRDL